MRKLLTAFLVLSCAVCFADTLVLNDGTRRDGRVQSVTSNSVVFTENGNTTTYRRSNVQSIEFASLGSSADSGTNDPFYSGSQGSDSSRSVLLPAGTEITVMNNENIDSSTASEGQAFSADVTENVKGENGRIVVPKGSEAELVLRRVGEQGKVSGNSELALDLQSVRVNGRRYTVSTTDIEKKGKEGIGANKRTATMVGGGAVLGTLIGAIAGGGKGAAIGAATGAAAGAGAQVLTRGKNVKVPAESKLRFKLDEPVTLESAY
jgi:outer membrane lipoprotein SlyB